MKRLASEMSWLTQAAAKADDQALTRVVGMLDQLRQRGAADQVLAMARQRLRGLRPARPLGFARLLFLPLDGAVVASPRWRRGEATIPRSAITPLAATLHRQLGAAAAELTERCQGRTTADAAMVAVLGAELWPEAALLLPREPPPEWAETGLGAADYQAVAELCRPLWLHGSAVWMAMAAGDQGPPEPLALAALQAVQPAGPKPFAATLASLLLRAREPARVAMLAARLDPAARAPAQAALEAMLDEPIPPLDLLDTAGAAQAAEAMLARLADMAQCSLLAGERQLRVAARRRAMDEACRDRFLAGAEADVVAPAARLVGAARVEPAEVAALEDGARELRALQGVGRRLGGGGAYEKATLAMAEALATLAPAARGGAGLHRMDLARTVEILCGPEAAQKLLEG